MKLPSACKTSLLSCRSALNIHRRSATIAFALLFRHSRRFWPINNAIRFWFLNITVESSALNSTPKSKYGENYTIELLAWWTRREKKWKIERSPEKLERRLEKRLIIRAEARLLPDSAQKEAKKKLKSNYFSVGDWLSRDPEEIMWIRREKYKRKRCNEEEANEQL